MLNLCLYIQIVYECNFVDKKRSRKKMLFYPKKNENILQNVYINGIRVIIIRLYL